MTLVRKGASPARTHRRTGRRRRGPPTYVVPVVVGSVVDDVGVVVPELLTAT
jgi:hypothetical protein